MVGSSRTWRMSSAFPRGNGEPEPLRLARTVWARAGRGSRSRARGSASPPGAGGSPISGARRSPGRGWIRRNPGIRARFWKGLRKSLPWKRARPPRVQARIPADRHPRPRQWGRGGGNTGARGARIGPRSGAHGRPRIDFSRPGADDDRRGSEENASSIEERRASPPRYRAGRGSRPVRAAARFPSTRMDALDSARGARR